MNLKNYAKLSGNYAKEFFRDTSEIEEIVNYYLSALLSDEGEAINLVDHVNTLVLLSELYPVLVDKPLWSEKIHEILCQIKTGTSTQELSPSLFGGYSDIAFSAHALKVNAGQYSNLSNKMDSQLITVVSKYVGRLEASISDLNECHYDVISGAAGVLGYTLLIDALKARQAGELLISYLIKITEISYPDGGIHFTPNWHIKGQNQLYEKDRIKFPSGVLKFGFAHGIAGPLAALSLSKLKGYDLAGLDNSIKRIVNEYMKYVYVDSLGCPYWEGQLTAEQYLQGTSPNILMRGNRMSWCYGSIGILRALYLAAKATLNESLEKWVNEKILIISQLKLERYMMAAPTLCHGYAGILAILKIQYRDTRDKNLLEGILKIQQEIISSFDPKSPFGFTNVELIETDKGLGMERSSTKAFLSGTTGIILALLSTAQAPALYEKHLLLV